MFSVVTDTLHTAGLIMHGTISAYMVSLDVSEKVKILFRFSCLSNQLQLVDDNQLF